MNLSKIMGSMTLRERRMLNEAVKQRIVEDAPSDSTSAAPAAEAPAAPAAPTPAPEPSKDSPIGSTLSKGGKILFALTDEGWKTTLRISEEQILALVIPAVKERIKNQMRSGSGQGDELVIVIGSLLDPGTANRSNGLFLKRDGKEFADPVTITAEKMAAIAKNLDLQYNIKKNPERQNLELSQQAQAKDNWTAIGSAIIRFQDADGAIELCVGKQKIDGLDDLFGTSNSGKIELAIKKAADSKSDAEQKDAGKNPNKKYLESFKIPLSWAMDGSIMKYMSDSILRGVGIGKIEFKLTNGYYVASVKLNSKEIVALKKKLDARKTANASAP